MTTHEFLNGFISPTCHKEEHSLKEYESIVSRPNVHQVKATTLYHIYKHNVFSKTDKRLNMKQFFHVCGQYLYYDKYLCEHGTEFFYYVEFNEENEMYNLTKPIIIKRLIANAPDKLTDLKSIMKAVSKE